MYYEANHLTLFVRNYAIHLGVFILAYANIIKRSLMFSVALTIEGITFLCLLRNTDTVLDRERERGFLHHDSLLSWMGPLSLSCPRLKGHFLIPEISGGRERERRDARSRLYWGQSESFE